MPAEGGEGDIIKFPEGGQEGIQQGKIDEKKIQIARLREELRELTKQKANGVKDFESDYSREHEIEIEDKQTEIKQQIENLILDISGALPDPKDSDSANPEDR